MIQTRVHKNLRKPFEVKISSGNAQIHFWWTFFALKCLSWRRQKRYFKFLWSISTNARTSTCSFFLWNMNTQYCRVALAWQRYSFHNEVTMGLGRAGRVGEGGRPNRFCKTFQAESIFDCCVCVSICNIFVSHHAQCKIHLESIQKKWNQINWIGKRWKQHRNLFSDEVNYRATDIIIWET